MLDMSSTTTISLLGEATPDAVAIWMCGAALILLFGALITKSKDSDLRFLTCCVLVGIFGILGFAFLAPRPAVSAPELAPPVHLNPDQASATTAAPVSDFIRDSARVPQDE